MKIAKALVISILLVFSVTPFAFGATITTTGDGNWSSTTPDAPWPSGTIPSANDDVVLSHTVTWDSGYGTRIPATSGTLTSLSGNGQLVIGDKAGALELHATTITAGTKGSTGTLAYSGTTCDSLTVNGDIVGAASGTNTIGIKKTSSKALTVNGACTGGGTTNASAVTIAISTGTIGINGNLLGGGAGGAHAVTVDANNTGVTITATSIKGGTSAVGASGLYINSASCAVTVTSGSTCVIEGGTGRAASGINCLSGGLTLSNSVLKDGATTGGFALAGHPPTWSPTAAQYYEIASGGKLALEVAAANLKSGVVNGTVTGTLATGYGLMP